MAAIRTAVDGALVSLEQNAHLALGSDETRAGIQAVVVIVELSPGVLAAEERAAHAKSDCRATHPLELRKRPLDLGAECSNDPDAAGSAGLVVKLEWQTENVHCLRRSGCVRVGVRRQRQAEAAGRALASAADLNEAPNIEGHLRRHIGTQHAYEMLLGCPAVVTEQVLEQVERRLDASAPRKKGARQFQPDAQLGGIRDEHPAKRADGEVVTFLHSRLGVLDALPDRDIGRSQRRQSRREGYLLRVGPASATGRISVSASSARPISSSRSAAWRAAPSCWSVGALAGGSAPCEPTGFHNRTETIKSADVSLGAPPANGRSGRASVDAPLGQRLDAGPSPASSGLPLCFSCAAATSKVFRDRARQAPATNHCVLTDSIIARKQCAVSDAHHKMLRRGSGGRLTRSLRNGRLTLTWTHGSDRS